MTVTTYDDSPGGPQYPENLAALNARLEKSETLTQFWHDQFQNLSQAVQSARVRRELRHRVSLLVNDWDRILAALEPEKR